ncbi:hypothetical protein ANN_05533 [Periplaneta americana]|uniref:RNase H type-1 domain-containing protein n=1 Tax=Periplaneta americana TaxID=6978 RepID=A0ABQ8TB30_PERAM|nr:hypothetical protein ANN_05533 [Periplaneta americana]
MKKRIDKYRDIPPQNPDQFWDQVLATRKDFAKDQNYFRDLVDSMPRKCQAVIDAGGIYSASSCDERVMERVHLSTCVDFGPAFIDIYDVVQRATTRGNPRFRSLALHCPKSSGDPPLSSCFLLWWSVFMIVCFEIELSIQDVMRDNEAQDFETCQARSLGYGTTSFDGEIIAINECLRNLLCHINKSRNAVILSDSKAAILSIVSKHTLSSQTEEITKMLSQLLSLNKRIVFQWIPSHCGILGNENADALAKKGSTATYRPVTKPTYYSVKRFIKSTYLDFNKQNLITQSQGKKWNSLQKNPQLIPDLPRKSSVAAFRLATGHDCLAKHLHRIGIYQSPNCPLCNSNQEMDSEHLKIRASVASHDNIFEKYWSARGQMTLLSNAWH